MRVFTVAECEQGIVIGQEIHATVKLDAIGFSWNENLQRKQNWTAKFTNIKENSEKNNSVFVIRAALWAEKLEYFLEYCWSWKNTLGKHAVAVKEEATWFKFWRTGALVTLEICVRYAWWFLNQFDIVSEATYKD